MKLLSELSEKEIFEHYNEERFEKYFEGNEDIKKSSDGKVWYEGNKSTGENLKDEGNEGDPIKFIIPISEVFSYPFFIDFY